MLFNRLYHRLIEGVYAVGNRYLKRRTPTLIYAPGRVGSMALFSDLREAGVFVFKIESLKRKNFRAQRFARRHIIDAKIKVNIITLIRDPIAMLCTYYFSRVIRDPALVPEASEAYRNGDTATLQDIFINDFLTSEVLDRYLRWYEDDWEPQLGFSFFDHPFDIAKQCGRFDHGRYRVLALRTELADEHKAEAVAGFLNLPGIVLTRRNVRAKRSEGKLYQEFKKTLVLPPEILDKVYDSPLCQHCFSQSEQEALRRKWSGRLS